MKIEKLTDNKIRIVFDVDELSKQNIDLKHLSKDNDNVRLLFKEILTEAEKQVGFIVDNNKLLVEVYATAEGYVIFTLTKYSNNNVNEKNSKQIKMKKKKISNDYQNIIYKFNTFEDFCDFCDYCNSTKLADLKNLAKNISLYEYKNFYYLCLSNINKNYKYINLFYTSISEFACIGSTSLVFKSTLVEHAQVIFKANAIKKRKPRFSTQWKLLENLAFRIIIFYRKLSYYDNFPRI